MKVKCKGAYKFRGEKQDLEEMMGNLIDNACKWAAKRVVVKASLGGAAAHQGRTWLTLLVDDDGPGLPAERRADALKRGQRLDETKPGSGLGLSIVKETAADVWRQHRAGRCRAGRSSCSPDPTSCSLRWTGGFHHVFEIDC